MTSPVLAMAERIEALITTRRGSVSFAELDALPGFTKRPDGTAFVYDRFNIVIWANLSDDAAAAIRYLIEAERIHLTPTSLLVYLVDGLTLTLPVAKQARRYKKPHWLPVVLDPGPDPDAGRRQ